jgi:RNA polymerase sigma-70 factor (ECF subfamily)
VVQGIRNLDDSNAYVRWLAQIARRCAADAGRRHAHALAPSHEEPVDPAGGPDDGVRSNERAATIRRAVCRLPGRLRAPVLLHFVEGMSYRDVAKTLGTSLSTVSRRIARALKKLRQRLGEEP